MSTVAHRRFALVSGALVVLVGLAMAVQGQDEDKKRRLKDLSPEELQRLKQWAAQEEHTEVGCANMVYAGKQSRCFSEGIRHALQTWCARIQPNEDVVPLVVRWDPFGVSGWFGCGGHGYMQDALL